MTSDEENQERERLLRDFQIGQRRLGDFAARIRGQPIAPPAEHPVVPPPIATTSASAGYSKASEERIKLVANTLSNAAVGVFAAGVFGPIAAYALTPNINSSVMAAIVATLICSIFVTVALCVGAWIYLGKLDEDGE
jgi:VIT1/CCC1 family predicted Fe2+/Mn2+ transporter